MPSAAPSAAGPSLKQQPLQQHNAAAAAAARQGISSLLDMPSAAPSAAGPLLMQQPLPALAIAAVPVDPFATILVQDLRSTAERLPVDRNGSICTAKEIPVERSYSDLNNVKSDLRGSEHNAGNRPSVYARVKYSRPAESTTELTIAAGQLVLVFEQGPEWWFGSIVTSVAPAGSPSKAGFFPGNYVESLESTAREGMAAASIISSSSSQLQEKRDGGSIASSMSTGILKSFAGFSSSRLFAKPSEAQALCFSLESLGLEVGIPIWKHTIFADLFCGGRQRRAAKTTVPTAAPQGTSHKASHFVECLKTSFRFISQTFQDYLLHEGVAMETRGTSINSVIKQIVKTFDTGHNICDSLPLDNSEPAKMLLFLEKFMGKLRFLEVGESVLAPFSWTSNDEEGCERGSVGGVVLIVTRTGRDSETDFSIAVVNACDFDCSLQYHAASIDPESGAQLRNLAFQFCNVPNARIDNTAFWYVLIRFLFLFLS
jgi:hypothetical protein